MTWCRNAFELIVQDHGSFLMPLFLPEFAINVGRGVRSGHQSKVESRSDIRVTDSKLSKVDIEVDFFFKKSTVTVG